MITFIKKRNSASPMIVACGLFLMSCGAPLKNADSVEGVFKDARKLDQKVTELCDVLRSRDQAPTLANFGLSDEICSKPGRDYVNYNALAADDPVRFSTIRTNSEPGQTKSDAVFNMQTRSQLFLNRTVLELAKSLLSSLDRKSENAKNNGESTTDDNKFQMEFIGDPVFDSKKFIFQLEFRMRSSKKQNGQVDIDNIYKVYGQLFEHEAIAVDISTKEIGNVTKTIIKDGKIMLFIIPHAGDVYMDIGTDINYHSFGVDEVMKESIKSTLGAGLRTLPKLVADADKK